MRLRWAARIAIAVLDVVLLATAVFVLTQRNVTTPITRSEALRRFRSARSHEEEDALAGPTTTTSTTAVAASAVRSGAPGAKAQPRAAPAPGAAPSQPPSGPGPYVLPDEGVYAYRTSGGDSISLASHTYPSETYASVTHAGGCQWKNEFDVAEENIDTKTMCGEPGRLDLLEDRRAVIYFGQTESEDLRCDPPMVLDDVNELPGATFNAVCHSSDTTAAVQWTYLGHEAVTVGNVPVDAVHLSGHGVLKGRADGTSDEQFWLLPQTGLVLRWERLEDANAHAFGASIHYHEQAKFLLESLTPST